MPQYMRQGYGKMLIDFSKYKENHSGNIQFGIIISSQYLTYLLDV